MTKPVLLLFGEQDVIFEPGAAAKQRDAAARTHVVLSQWLEARGF